LIDKEAHMRAKSALLAVSTLIAILVAGQVAAYSYGWEGTTLRDTGTGCASCHGGTPGGVSVMLSGPDSILPGATARFEVTIGQISNPIARAGFTAAVSKVPGQQPMFSSVPGEPTSLKDEATEIVNDNTLIPLRLPVDGAVSYLIDLTMPALAELGAEYNLYSVGAAGHRFTNVGWAHAANVAVTVGPPSPELLNADQATVGTSRIALDWMDSGQGEDFRLLGKTGGHPLSPTDPDAFLVYEGPDLAAEAVGLMAGVTYYFALWGKVPSQDVHSARAALAEATTQDDWIFLDRFESDK
jgi:hypothetical protein